MHRHALSMSCVECAVTTCCRVSSQTACFVSACLAFVFEQLCCRVCCAAWCTLMAATALTLLVLQIQNSCLCFQLADSVLSCCSGKPFVWLTNSRYGGAVCTRSQRPAVSWRVCSADGCVYLKSHDVKISGSVAILILLITASWVARRIPQIVAACRFYLSSTALVEMHVED
jgi:hypothetical protein